MPLKMEAPLSPSPASTLAPPSTEAADPGSFLGLLWDGEAVSGAQGCSSLPWERIRIRVLALRRSRSVEGILVAPLAYSPKMLQWDLPAAPYLLSVLFCLWATPGDGA